MKYMKYMVALLVCAGIANASIITVNSVTYTGTASEAPGLQLEHEINIINGTGLSAALTDANIGTVTHAAATFAAPGNAWATVDAGPGAGDWFAAGENDGTVVFEFDLGSATAVGTFAAWGYHFGSFNDNAMSNITLDFSSDGGLNTDSSQTIAVPFGATFDASSVVVLAPVASANYITMTVNDNHFGNAGNGGDRVGIAEVAFSTIPEPATLGLVAVFGGAVLFMRRKMII